jgi:hypothetical protein
MKLIFNKQPNGIVLSPNQKLVIANKDSFNDIIRYLQEDKDLFVVLECSKQDLVTDLLKFTWDKPNVVVYITDPTILQYIDLFMREMAKKEYVYLNFYKDGELRVIDYNQGESIERIFGWEAEL